MINVTVDVIVVIVADAVVNVVDTVAILVVIAPVVVNIAVFLAPVVVNFAVFHGVVVNINVFLDVAGVTVVHVMLQFLLWSLLLLLFLFLLILPYEV